MKNSESEFYIQGNKYWEINNFLLAAQWFKSGCEKNDIKCIVNLGYFYDTGIFFEKNKIEAIKLYKKAWQLGDISVEKNIALAYRDLGNKAKSELWFSKAAKNYNSNDLFLLSFRTTYQENPRKLKITPLLNYGDD